MTGKADPWEHDKLGRRPEAETVYEFITSQIESRRARHLTASFVLNINADWGHGKTFFLNGMRQMLTDKGHVVAHINAWENDLTNEPLVAIMASIEVAMKPYLSPGSKVAKKWKALVKASAPLAVSLVKGVATSLLKRHTDGFLDDAVAYYSGEKEEKETGEDTSSELGDGASAVVEKLGDDFTAKLIEAHNKHLQSIEKFRSDLAAISESIRDSQQPDSMIYILVDELDRCRPSHAITLLESIKHLFNTDGVAFIIATNTEQLCASIKGVYGSEFAARDYLRRFFDRTYTFKEASTGAFVDYLFDAYGIDPALYINVDIDACKCSVDYFKSFNLSLRDIEQCFEMFATIHHLWRERMPLQLPLIWPLIISYHQGNMTAFDFFSGKEGRQKIEAHMPNPVVVVEKSGPNRYDQLPTRILITTADLTLGYIEGIQENLPSMADGRVHSSTTYLTSNYFRNEMNAYHAGGYQLNAPPVSIVRKYPDLVRLAVQFESQTTAEG